MQEKEQKVSPIKQRILQFVDYLQISKRDFYSKIGVSRGTLESKTGITEDIMAKFIATYPEVSLTWLIIGKGSMLNELPTSTPVQIVADEAKVSYKAMDGGIPLIPISAMAGAFRGDIQVLDYECERYVVPLLKEAEFLIPVRGDSMLPRYCGGDIVACKNVPIENVFYQPNKIYVLDTAQGALIKRVKAGSNSEHLLIVSDNPNYPPFELHISQIYHVAIVIGGVCLE